MKHKFLIIALMWIIFGKFQDVFPLLNHELISLIPVIITLCLIFDFYPKSSRFNKFKGLEKKIYQLFENTKTLQINDHVSLVCTSRHINQIFFYYHDEKIASLSEFKNEYPDQYKQLLTSILNQAHIQSELPKKESVHQASAPFQDSIEAIESYNIDIPDEEISLGLYYCANQLKYLQKLLLEYPTENDKLRKLEEYYLPILLNILDNYHKITKSDEAKAIKKKLNQTLVLVNEAIKNITHSLFDEDKLNMKVDMNVLESLLKKDGLIEDEMSKDQLKAFMEANHE